VIGVVLNVVRSAYVLEKNHLIGQNPSVKLIHFRYTTGIVTLVTIGWRTWLACAVAVTFTTIDLDAGIFLLDSCHCLPKRKLAKI
jgi:hypothetical protein